jgi:hypothetical protein
MTCDLEKNSVVAALDPVRVIESDLVRRNGSGINHLKYAMQRFGSALVSMRIRIQRFISIRIRIQEAKPDPCGSGS